MAQWSESRGALMAVVCEHHTMEDGYLPSPMVLATDLSREHPTVKDLEALDVSAIPRKKVEYRRFTPEQQREIVFRKPAYLANAQPVSVKVDTFGTGDERAAEEFVMNAFDFRPRMIIQKLDLLRPIYTQTTNYGHFGRPGLPWEAVEKAAAVAK